jgi:PhzF family phenazine biosynthesis protein
MTGTKTFVVDAFTGERFKGNPAGVCLPHTPMTESLMLSIAQELGLSETAFVRKIEGDNRYSIRYYSPKMEIPLCGHATLASAKIIFRDSDIHEIHFMTVEHLDLTVQRREDRIVMEFPVYDTVPATAPQAMLEALGVTTVVNTAFSQKNKIILLEIADPDLLAGLNPNFGALLASHKDINGVLVTAPSADKNYDYHYRYFWPWAGTNEDPVTGGVQTFLAKYWSVRLNKTIMRAFQSSRRTGYMTVELQQGKVLITGQAIVVFDGVLEG